jgi:hypothetical protein
MGANTASRRLAHRIGLKSIKSHSDFPVGGGKTRSVEFFALTAAEYFEQAY